MKKILGLLLVSSSIFSMQLDTVKSNKFQEKLSRHSDFNASEIGKAHAVLAPKTRSTLVSADKLSAAELISLSKICINRKAVFAPERLGSVELYHGKKGFSIHQDGKKHVIKKYFTDPLMRNITREQLGAFLQGGYLSINRMNDGEFSLQARGRLNGGGPAFGAFMYWVTKSLCYGTAAAAVGTTVVATGGVIAGAATAVAANAVTGSVLLTAGTSTVGTAIATTAGTVVGTAAAGVTVASGAGSVGVAIAGASAAGATVAGVTLVEAAALTTAAGVTAAAGTTTAASVGTAAACVIGIETLSVAVGTFFGMLPTP